MLVLSRRPSEKITFPGTGITIQVLSFRGNAVKIGIDAPPEIQVLRAELAAASNISTPQHATTFPTDHDRVERCRILLGQLAEQLAQGLGEAAVGEILAEMKEVLELPQTSSTTARPTRMLRAPTAVVPDFVTERAGFKGILKKDE